MVVTHTPVFTGFAPPARSHFDFTPCRKEEEQHRKSEELPEELSAEESIGVPGKHFWSAREAPFTHSLY